MTVKSREHFSLLVEKMGERVKTEDGGCRLLSFTRVIRGVLFRGNNDKRLDRRETGRRASRRKEEGYKDIVKNDVRILGKSIKKGWNSDWGTMYVDCTSEMDETVLRQNVASKMVSEIQVKSRRARNPMSLHSCLAPIILLLVF